jgi:hypothetical protein
MAPVRAVPNEPDDDDAAAAEPVDPWDPAGFKYSDDEYAQSEIRARKVRTKIRVQQPDGKSWFMLHPSIKLKAALYIRESEASVRPELYLVRQAAVPLFGGQLTPVLLQLGITSLGVEFLWPRKLPRDGRITDIQAIQQDIADEAEQHWIRMEWSNADHAHIYHVAEEDLGDPAWPDMTMTDYLRLGFKGRVIDDDTHPVAAEFMGRKVG